MKNAIRNLSKTTSHNKNFRIYLDSFVVDVDRSFPFDIFKYLGVEITDDLIENWDSDEQLPLSCEVECTIMSKGKPITCPIIIPSECFVMNYPKFPPLYESCQILRKQYVFSWKSGIEFPLYYSELPSDSILSIVFYSSFFYSKPKKIAETIIKLFTRRTPRLRIGPFVVDFNDSNYSKLQRHIRRLYTGKDKAFGFVDQHVQYVCQNLHPKDAESFFLSLLNPNEIPTLSSSSHFVTLTICSPEEDPTVMVVHDNIILSSTDSKTLNPYQRLYYDLSHAQGGGSVSLLKDSNVMETLNKIKQLPPLCDLPAYYKNCLFNNYRHCMNDQLLLPPLFRSINWDNKDESKSIAELLVKREPIEAEYALEFFTPRYNIPAVREFAVRCIKHVSKEEISLYIPQLIQALKVPHSIGLSSVLIEHAKNDPVFASQVFWIAQVEISTSPEIASFIMNLLNDASEEVKTSLDDQKKLVSGLTDLLVNNHNNKNSTHQIRDKIGELLRDDPVHSQLQNFSPVRLPLDPRLVVVGIDPSDIKVFQSKLRPIMITFKLENGGKYRVIFKIGDDMRQDQLILQLFEVMDHIFKSSSMQLNITAYKTLAFSATFGCCQFIDNSKAILDIAKGDQTIRDFLKADGGDLEKKIDLFTESLAAYCVMTYVLKIGDRHDNNILVTRDGRLLHIDYGFILGDVTKPFTPPLKLSREMVDTIGNNGLQRICDWACPAFNSLRKRARLILVLIELMFTAPLDCFQQNPLRRLQQVENALLLGCTEIEATNSLQATLSESLNSKMQVLWDAVHVVAVSTNGPSADN